MNAQRQYIDTEKQSQDSQTVDQNSLSSSTTTIDTDPGVFEREMGLEKIARAYENVLGPLNMYKARVIEDALKAGLDAGAVLDAIEQTAMAPRPSHPYLAAILRRYAAQGVTTAEAALADRQRFAVRRSAAGREGSAWFSSPERKNPALDYAQRDNSGYENFTFYDVSKWA